VSVKPNQQPTGISLIEMMIVLVILAVTALALASGLIASMRSTSTVDEREAAIREARNQLDRVIGNRQALVNPVGVFPNYTIGQTATDYGVLLSLNLSATQSFPTTFGVSYLNQEPGQKQHMVSLQALPGGGTPTIGVVPQVGEIVAMFDETVTQMPGTKLWPYGRDLTGGVNGGPDGKPDGVTFTPIGDMDLDQVPLATPTDPSGNPDVRAKIYGQKAGCMPIGAIVRWQGTDGRPQRVELWTVTDFIVYNTTNAAQF